MTQLLRVSRSRLLLLENSVNLSCPAVSVWHFVLRNTRQLAIYVLFSLAAVNCSAQEITPDAYSGLRWRFLGTHRGGRITAVAGIAGEPNIYYAGTPNGGVWKTTDVGRTWNPIFDAMHVASIGAIAIAASNPNVIYVGTGEQGRGRGVFKSTDAGVTWSSAGLAEEHYISSIIVDPKNPDVVVVGAFGSSVLTEPRGIFRSTDGGKSWTKTSDGSSGSSGGPSVSSSGVADIAAAPDDAHILYAAVNPPPGEPGERDQPGESLVYFSADEGASWKQTGVNGLPAKGRGRIGLAVIPGTSGRGVLAIMNQGLFRSGNGGANWQRITAGS